MSQAPRKATEEQNVILDLSQPPPPRATIVHGLRQEAVTSIANVVSQVLRSFRHRRVRLAIRRLRRAGATIGDACRFADIPCFGSEPWLITIGRNVAIACDVVLITHDGGTHVFRHLERYRKVVKYGRINILDNCVIGERAILLPGVTIGPDSVVAAGSVVSRSVPPGVLVGGNPAEILMTVHQYAEWSLAATPDYDEEEYARDQRASVLKMNLRGSVPMRPLREHPKATHD